MKKSAPDHHFILFTNCSLKTRKLCRSRASADSIVDPLKQFRKRIKSTGRDKPPPTRINQSDGHVHQILHYRANPSAGNFFASRTGQLIFFRFFDAYLPNDTKQIVGQQPQKQNQRITGETAAGESFQPHIRFDFRMILFTGTMILIKQYDFLGV